MTQAVVQLRNLTKRIGNKTIVDNLSFDIPAGEVFGFLGPNGAGKTTTIRMIMGLISMSQGQVLVKGIDVTKDFEKAMRHIGAIVENPEMYKFLSGYENLWHFAKMTPGVSDERIMEVVRLVGLENRIRDKVKTYSLGMRQRLGLAQALLHRPSVLILDEPTNGLDPAGIRELRDHLRMLTEKEGLSVIVSSHLLSEMELMCDRVAIIQAGKLVDVKTMKEMKAADASAQDSVFFEVEKPAEAKRVLAPLWPDSAVVEHEGAVELTIAGDQVPVVISQLVSAGINVFGVRKQSKSLEDKFLEMTSHGGGGQIV